jgi:uncharacterized protein with HEPN domain
MSRKDRRLADYLGHVLEAIERIEQYTAGKGFDDFARNVMAQDAVVRNLEIIGEACRNIERGDPGFLLRHPGFPLRAAIEMRNVLAHGYFSVDLEIVWRTVRTSLPGLKAQVLQATPAERGQ